MYKLLSAALSLLAVCTASNATEFITVNERYLTEVPQVYPAESGDWQPDKINAIYYDGPEWQGKPTKVFAYMGIPESTDGQPVPGIVLVHGGGGTAFRPWVELWVSRGYAAIAMDTCGMLPFFDARHVQLKNPDGGPAGWENSFNQIDQPLADQWPSQAVNMISRAYTLLAAQPGVDADNIGISGISWGGYLTCLTVGADSRFKYAVPVYGCGFIWESPCWKNYLSQPSMSNWKKICDPSSYLAEVQMPIMWVTGTNDPAYPLHLLEQSMALVQDAPVYLSITPRMIHGHAGHGEKPEVILAFADWLSGRCDVPFPEFAECYVNNGEVIISGFCAAEITGAELLYSCEDETSGKKSTEWYWDSMPVEVINIGNEFYVTFTLPQNTKQYILNIFDGRNVPFSSPICSAE